MDWRRRLVVICAPSAALILATSSAVGVSSLQAQQHREAQRLAAVGRAAEITASLNAYGQRTTSRALDAETARADELQRQLDAEKAKTADLSQKLDQVTQERDQYKARVFAAYNLGVGSGPASASVVAAVAAGVNRFAFGYCTWYVDNLRPVPWLGNAIEWWGQAGAYGWARGSQPRVGAIQVSRDGWPWNPFGHVALVTSVLGDGSWWVTEMNFTYGWNHVDSRHVLPGGTLVGFIY